MLSSVTSLSSHNLADDVEDSVHWTCAKACLAPFLAVHVHEDGCRRRNAASVGALDGDVVQAIDIGLAVENIVLAAAEKGIGSCILGMFTESAVKECIGLGKRDKRKVELVIALGVPVATEPRPKKRKETSDIAVFLK